MCRPTGCRTSLCRFFLRLRVKTDSSANRRAAQANVVAVILGVAGTACLQWDVAYSVARFPLQALLYGPGLYIRIETGQALWMLWTALGLLGWVVFRRGAVDADRVTASHPS
jgi:hypothetical protein